MVLLRSYIEFLVYKTFVRLCRCPFPRRRAAERVSLSTRIDCLGGYGSVAWCWVGLRILFKLL